MALVGLISDTHDRLPETAIKALQDCDRIIHAGDICTPPILWELETIAPVNAVLGNNDFADFGAAVNPTADVVIDGVRFIVTHKPTDLRHALHTSRERHPDFAGPVVAVYGHKHVPFLEKGEDGLLYDLMISPGSVFRSRDALGRKTVGLVEVSEGSIISAKVVELDGTEVLKS